MPDRPSVLFVCLCNICRSPLAEAIFRRDAEQACFDVEVDSAGTGSWHVGEAPDPRARAVGSARGANMALRARQVAPEDFERFDLILGMDSANVAELKRWRGARPEKVFLASDFAPAFAGRDVPDPYYGDRNDFEAVADMLEAVSAGLLATLRSRSTA